MELDGSFDEVAWLAAAARRRRRRLVAAAGAAALLVALVSLHHFAGARLRGWSRGEIDLAGRPRYRPSHTVDDATFAAIDLAAIHKRLFPGWMIAQAHAGSPEADAAAERAFNTLRAEAGRDPNLAALLDELHGLVVNRLVIEAHRIQYLCWAWDDYLDRRGARWWLAAGVTWGSGRPKFYTMSYRVLADLQVAIGSRSSRARLLTRADETNLEEPYLGLTSDEREGALVVIDRVAELAGRQLWPLLDAAAEPELPALDRAWAPQVRAEVRALLPADAFAALASTARARAALVRAVSSIEDRRRCGGTWIFPSIPVRGFLDEDLARLEHAAARDRGRDCPSVTDEEARLIADSTRALAAAADLDDAFAGLLAFAARGVVAHEARHAADAAQSGPDGRLDCARCPPELTPLGRDELSAYLGSFATRGVAYAAMFQSCAIETGSHGAALALVRARLLPRGCAGPPPDDLAARAAALERELIGRSDAITLAADFPEKVSLPSGF
jgi:hypothetical protein